MKPCLRPSATPIKPSIVQPATDSPSTFPLKLESNYVHVSIDPSSTSTGIAIFDLSGKYLTGYTVKVSDGVIPTLRLFYTRNKFIEEWERRLGTKVIANLCCMENVSFARYSVLVNAAGAILSSGKISSDLQPSTFISPTQWKYVARQLGDYSAAPKGIAALRNIGWGFELPDTDDLADAILIYLAYVWYKSGVIWLSEKRYVHSWHIKKPYKAKTPAKRSGKKKTA